MFSPIQICFYISFHHSVEKYKSCRLSNQVSKLIVEMEVKLWYEWEKLKFNIDAPLVKKQTKKGMVLDKLEVWQI